MASAADRWADALAGWAIPPRILDAAPEDPWAHLPAMFRSGDDDPSDTPSMRAAAAVLGDGGTVLDIGCGGGRSSLPLGRLVTHLTGVDQAQAMLDQLLVAAARAGTPCEAILGRWPDVGAAAPVADLVVCHHVAYNVGPIAAFVAALDTHARRAVVVELTAHHPQTPLDDLWRHFWDLERPSQPTADLFVEVVREAGHEPVVTAMPRPARAAPITTDELVAHLRRRLCLTPDRDDEIAEVLGARPLLSADDLVTVTWSPTHGSTEARPSAD